MEKDHPQMYVWLFLLLLSNQCVKEMLCFFITRSNLRDENSIAMGCDNFDMEAFHTCLSVAKLWLCFHPERIHEHINLFKMADRVGCWHSKGTCPSNLDNPPSCEFCQRIWRLRCDWLIAMSKELWNQAGIQMPYAQLALLLLEWVHSVLHRKF